MGGTGKYRVTLLFNILYFENKPFTNPCFYKLVSYSKLTSNFLGVEKHFLDFLEKKTFYLSNLLEKLILVPY